MTLEGYDEKRDFDRTMEPAPADSRQPTGNLAFVVQKHAARRLHYDFRLEVDGVLKSWPVPKGPSLDPEEKRLAVMVEDHPFDYRTFEGVIPKGSYGAGHVIVWDAGVYSPDEGGRLSFGNREEAEERMRQGLEAGKLSFTLRGHKLRGSWTLVRTTRSPTDWLLIKHKDGYADASRDVLKEDRSVVSGLTIADLKAGRLPDPAGTAESNGREAEFPSTLKPMMARLGDKPFSHPEWLFEPKLDGFRAVAFVRGGEVVLRSRNGKDLTEHFPEVVADLSTQPEDEVVLDGEIVALDEDGMPSFGLIQQRTGWLKGIKTSPPDGTSRIVYYVFDLPYAGGRDLQRLPLSERKALLSQKVLPGDSIEVVQHVEEDGESFFRGAVKMGLEGMVAKRRQSLYEPGARSGSWLKIKHVQAQEFVVGGYTEGSGARSVFFGSLLLGYYDADKLTYAGKAGSGFDESTLESLHETLEGLRSDESPFSDEQDVEDKEPIWVSPDLVVQVKFSEWTHEDRLRAPVFLGLRPEVSPLTVIRERPDAGVPSEPNEPAADDGLEQDIVDKALVQLSGDEEKLLLELGSDRVALTNLNKEFWPATDGRSALTKGDMIRYYTAMAPVLLTHLRDRPLTLTRYPNGILGDSFYQKNWTQDIPEFVETVRLFSSHNEGDVEYIMVNNLPTLVWLAQLADLELHPWLSRTVLEPDGTHLTTDFAGSSEAIKGSALSYPDFVVFDLDPYIYSGKEKEGDEPELNRHAFTKTREVALALKDILDELSLSSFVKTSGKTGLHAYVPVQRQYEYGVTRKTCETIGRFLMQSRPMDVTMEWTVSKRAGKIFLDHNQNVRGKNMASIYSLRPLPGAPVSTPVRWDELNEIYPTDFTIETVPERVEQVGDLWADVLEAKHDLSRLLEKE